MSVVSVYVVGDVCDMCVYMWCGCICMHIWSVVVVCVCSMCLYVVWVCIYVRCTCLYMNVVYSTCLCMWCVLCMFVCDVCVNVVYNIYVCVGGCMMCVHHIERMEGLAVDTDFYFFFSFSHIIFLYL